MHSLMKRLMASTTATSMALVPIAGRANPLGGQVTAGSATIQGQGTASVIVQQSTNRAIIDWRSFNIAPSETIQFEQPSSSSVTLNRVTGGMGASQIYGTISANGGVYIVNPDGVLFGAGSKVNVGSFLATTNDIANRDFMSGHYKFSISGNPSASIVNQGTITATKGGFAALVAPGVRNDGVITARLGTVGLASANAFTLDLYGDNLIKLQPNDSIASEVKDVATGQTLASLVQNTGTLKANGGTVALTAVSSKRILDSVINSSGVIEANTVGMKNGKVIFGAATADTKMAGAPIQTVKVSGRISASGKKTGTIGGKIQITGENIVLAKAKLNASGKAGGGTILVGGDFKGGDPNAPAVTLFGQSFESSPVPNATNVSVGSGSVLNASAIKSGNGGKIVVWSNDTTTFAGSVLATGGATSGNGGFVEVSGKQNVNFENIKVQLSAPKGIPGTILFDPDIENIDQNVANTLANLLDGTSASNGGDGHISGGNPLVIVTADTINILPNVDILKTDGGNATLGLFAYQGINIGAGVVIGSSSNALNLYLDADASHAALFSNFVPGTITSDITSLSNFAGAVAFDDIFPNGLPSVPISPFATPSVPDRTGQLLINVAPSTAPTAGFDNYASAFQSLLAADVNIAATARFYLNGGTLTTFGNRYTIASTTPSAGFITAYEPVSALDPCAANPTCGIAGYLLEPSPPDQNGSITPGFYFQVVEQLQRNQTPVPGGVLSEGAIPGLGQISFSSIANTASSVGLTAAQAYVFTSAFNRTSNWFEQTTAGVFTGTVISELEKELLETTSSASASKAINIAQKINNVPWAKVASAAKVGGAFAFSKLLPVLNVAATLTNSKVPIALRVAIGLVQTALTAIDLAAEGISGGTATPAVAVINFGVSIALDFVVEMASKNNSPSS